MEFKAGDQVICIEPNAILEKGHVYIVEGTTISNGLTYLNIKGMENRGFYPQRFSKELPMNMEDTRSYLEAVAK